MIVLLCLALLAVAHGPQGEKVPGEAIDYYEHGEFQRAAEILTLQVHLNADDGALRLWLGKSCYKLRKWDEAIRHLEKAVQLEPSNSQYHLWLGRAFGKRAEHSSFIAALGPARRVLKEFETAVRLSSESIDARFDLLEYYLDAPGILGGGRDKALDQIDHIAQLDRRLGYTARARLYEKERKWILVQKELTEATVEFPGDVAAYVDLADFHMGRSDFVLAADNARKALELRPNNRAQLVLAASLVSLGRSLVEAEQILRTLIAGPLGDEDPSFEEVHYWLGRVLFARGMKLEAKQLFELALKFNPDYARARTALEQAR